MTQLELQQVLDRAQEIVVQGTISPDGNPTYDELFKAAAEAGIANDAVAQALHETISPVLDEPLEKGDIVFARVPSGEYLSARVTSRSETAISVKFDNDSEANVVPSACLRFRNLPGEELYCPWGKKDWRICKLDSFNKKNKMAYMIGPGGTKRMFYLKEMRMLAPGMEPPEVRPVPLDLRLLFLVAASAAFLGSLLTWFFLHR